MPASAGDENSSGYATVNSFSSSSLTPTRFSVNDFLDHLVAEHDLKIVGLDRLAVGSSSNVPSRSAMTVSPISDARPSTGIKCRFLLQTIRDQVFDLAVLDRFHAARDLDAFVFRRRDLRHHLDMNVQCDRLRAVDLDVLGIFEMQLRFGQRMQLVFLDRLGDLVGTTCCSTSLLISSLYRSRTTSSGAIAFSKSRNARTACVFLADLAVSIL